ncbi:MAG TPA: hypothetical protein DEG76_13710, partial [Pseudohongiella sp.]|nr:hypothetical protein [Pseudohongiella sp.]
MLEHQIKQLGESMLAARAMGLPEFARVTDRWFSNTWLTVLFVMLLNGSAQAQNGLPDFASLVEQNC